MLWLLKALVLVDVHLLSRQLLALVLLRQVVAGKHEEVWGGMNLDYFTSKKVSKKSLFMQKKKKSLLKRDPGSVYSALCYMDA